MTESVSDAAPVTEAPVVDAFTQQALDRLVETIAELNTVNTQIKAMSGDPTAILEALRDTYTDNGGEFDKLQATITKFDQALSKACAQRDEMLKPVVESMKSDSTDNLAPLMDKAAALTKTVNAGRNYLVGVNGGDEAIVANLPKIVKAKGTGGATGGKRIRGRDWIVNGTLATQKDAKQVEKSSASAAARIIGVDTKVVQEAFWTAQGTQVAGDFKPEVTFTVTNGDVTYTVVSRAQDDTDELEGTQETATTEAE